MALVLEIEYLTGVVSAAQGPESDVPDWPPQPDRIFSALVATWGARGEQANEAKALRWLEQQSVPLLFASEAEPRTAPISFVPPNDKAVLPQLRGRQPRRFPVTRPDDPIVRLLWKNTHPDPDIFEALNRLATNTSYVGHSASLTRCLFLHAETPISGQEQAPRRRVYGGRFEELRQSYTWFVESGGRRGRPRPGERVVATMPANQIAQSCFDSDWLVLEHIDGGMPDIRACALVAKEIRDTILSGYKDRGMGNHIPYVVCGHNQDGSPSREPHLSIVPLAYAGSSPYADGHLLGFALVPPRSSGLLQDMDFLQAMRTVAKHDNEAGRRLMRLGNSGLIRLRRFGLALSPTLEPEHVSLDSKQYTWPAQRFGTVTPIVLDRHLKESGEARQQEISEQIKAACRNIGLPEPSQVVADKHSAVEGAPSAQPSGRSPEWMRWRLPSSLSSRFLTHAVLCFSMPVQGPVILGAGRFVGMGLCLPIEEKGAGGR